MSDCAPPPQGQGVRTPRSPPDWSLSLLGEEWGQRREGVAQWRGARGAGLPSPMKQQVHDVQMPCGDCGSPGQPPLPPVPGRRDKGYQVPYLAEGSCEEHPRGSRGGELESGLAPY